MKCHVVCHNTLCFLSGMNQFNQMGMPPMGQRSTPPLPMGATGNQVSTELMMDHKVCNVPM